MTIQPIVEGFGEVQALPVLLRRLQEVSGACRSFRRMVRAFGIVAAGTGASLQEWPPPSWIARE